MARPKKESSPNISSELLFGGLASARSCQVIVCEDDGALEEVIQNALRTGALVDLKVTDSGEDYTVILFFCQEVTTNSDDFEHREPRMHPVVELIQEVLKHAK